MISAQVSCVSGPRNKRGEPSTKIVLRGTRAELGTIAEGIIEALSERGNLGGAVGDYCEAEVEIQSSRAKKKRMPS